MKKIILLLLVFSIINKVYSQNVNSNHKSGKQQRVKTASSYLPGYTGAIGCEAPMNAEDFEVFKSNVSSRLSDEDKIVTANQSIFSYCLLCSQLKEILDLMGFEDNKLHYAKLAYRHIYDIGNYKTVTEVFEFQRSIDDLNEFISSKDSTENK